MDTIKLIRELMILRDELVADHLVVEAYKVEDKIKQLIEEIQA